MAKYGLSTFLYAPLDADAEKYGEVEQMKGAISYKESLKKNDLKVYADNVLSIKDDSVNGGTLTLGVLDNKTEIFGPLLGRKTREITLPGSNEKTTVYVGNGDDVATPVGFGFVENIMESGNIKGYCVKFYPKVTFAPYDDEGSTKGENAEYKTTSVTGQLYNMDNGDYLYTAQTKTVLEAVTTLYALFGAEVPADVLAGLDGKGQTPGPDPAPGPDSGDNPPAV